MELFQGTGVALITPFNEDLSVDFAALEKLIEYQIENGTNAIISLGTTGEPSTLSNDEKIAILRFTKKVINNRVQFIVGAGANCTATARENVKIAQSEGADAILAVTPYYNKCTQNGIVEYYSALRKETTLPIIAYNVPGRTGVNILPQTFAKAVKVGAVDAIKEASGDVSQATEIARLITEELDNKAVLYSGDDGLTLPLLSLGARGVISVLSNVAPKTMSDLTDSFFKGDINKARKIQLAINPLNKALFCEVNPTPVKAGCAMLGLCKNILREPLLPMEEIHVPMLKSALEKTLSLKF